MTGNLARLARDYLLRPPAYMMLTADDQRLARQDPRRFTRAWPMLMVLSLLWGILSVGIWEACYAVFGPMSDLHSLMPALVTASAFSLWLFRRALVALAEVFAPDAATRGLILSLLAVGVVMCFTALRRSWDSVSESSLPVVLQWFRPEKHHRVLMLAPLWGAWAMMIAPKFSKPSANVAPCVAAFAAGCGPVAAAFAMAVPLAWALFYFHFLGRWQLVIPAATIGTSIAGSMLLCRLGGGLTRRTLLAANVLTQLVFILAYLAARNLGRQN